MAAQVATLGAPVETFADKQVVPLLVVTIAARGTHNVLFQRKLLGTRRRFPQDGFRCHPNGL